MKKLAWFEHLGSCHYTEPSFRFFDESKPEGFNPEELRSYCYSMDDFRLYQDKAWTGQEVELPDWIPVDWHTRYFKDYQFRKIVIALEPAKNGNLNGFKQSLRTWFLNHDGTLTGKQYDALFKWEWGKRY